MATTKNSPFARMKEKFGDKEKLVDRLVTLVGQVDGAAGEGGDKDAIKSKFLATSNAKLLRIFEVASEIREKFGTKEKLAEAVAQAAGKAKDQAYVAKLKKLAEVTPARVLDLLRATTRRTKAAKAA